MNQISIHRTLMLSMIFFIVSITSLSCAREKAKLTINISDCRDAKNNAYLSELKVLKNGKEFKILKPKFENKLVLKDLEFGTYTLMYNSLINKEVSLKVEITEGKKYSINLCTNFLDYSKETYKPIIDQLKENDYYTIEMSSQGCFHSTTDTLTIKRNNGIYTITWGEKSKKLTNNDIEVLRHFEIELNYMTDGGCTTIDTYNVNYNGTTKQIFDGGCDWNGGYYLKKQLFGD